MGNSHAEFELGIEFWTPARDVFNSHHQHSTLHNRPMTFPCYVLGKGSSYTYIETHTVEDGATARTVITGGKGAFTQWVWVELIESSETIRPANTHQVHAEFI